MNELLKAIYDDFYNKPPAVQIKDEIERSHQELIGRLDKVDRRLVLSVIDCKDQIAEELSIDSFIAGFHLGWKLSHELNMYDQEYSVQQATSSNKALCGVAKIGRLGNNWGCDIVECDKNFLLVLTYYAQIMLVYITGNKRYN